MVGGVNSSHASILGRFADQCHMPLMWKPSLVCEVRMSWMAGATTARRDVKGRLTIGSSPWDAFFYTGDSHRSVGISWPKRGAHRFSSFMLLREGEPYFLCSLCAILIRAVQRCGR